MDKQIWEDAYRRAAEIAPVRVDRRMQDILYGDVPTFMELPYARQPCPERGRRADDGSTELAEVLGLSGSHGSSRRPASHLV